MFFNINEYNIKKNRNFVAADRNAEARSGQSGRVGRHYGMRLLDAFSWLVETSQLSWYSQE